MLQNPNLETGEITAILSGQLDGRPLRWLNFVPVDSVGALWCSVSTMAEDYGYYRARHRQRVHLPGRTVNFPNCMALDHHGDYLYVVPMLADDVVPWPIEGETIRPPEPLGSPLGNRRPGEFGPDAGRFLADP